MLLCSGIYSLLLGLHLETGTQFVILLLATVAVLSGALSASVLSPVVTGGVSRVLST
jgi:hypothetical protein